MRIARVSSTLICYCSQLQSSVAHSNVSFSRVVPTPLCPLLSKLLSGLFCISGLSAEIPFQLPVFNLFSGTKVDQNIQELMSKLAQCWNTSWWLSVSPRQTSHGHLFDVSHEVINESSKIVWGNNQVAKETQPSNRPEESDWTTKGIRDSVGEFRLESNKK